MPIRKSTIRLAVVLILAGALALPAGVAAQCIVTATNIGTDTQFGMTYMYVTKTLSNTYNCTLVMQMGVIQCAPGYAGDLTNVLSGSAFNTAMTPTCSWDCDCGTVTIDGSDNLPVELMEFSIEDEQAAEPSERGNAGAAGEDDNAA